MDRVFVDTNVLFPFSVMDLVFALSEDSVHTVVWSDALLDEWERVIVGEHRSSPDTAASATAAIREFFADSRVESSAYEHLIDEMPGNDPDDHHHMAAAIGGRATVLITENIKDSQASRSRRAASAWCGPTPICANCSMSYPTKCSARSCVSPARSEIHQERCQTFSTPSQAPGCRPSPLMRAAF